MNKEISNVCLKKQKTPLEYFKEIQDVSREQFAVPVYNTTNKMQGDTYKRGDGDTIRAVRPGSMDFLQYKSKGLHV